MTCNVVLAYARWIRYFTFLPYYVTYHTIPLHTPPYPPIHTPPYHTLPYHTTPYPSTARYHTGTLAFGSLIIAIIKMIRLMLQWIQDKLEEQGADNPLVKVRGSGSMGAPTSPGSPLPL